MESPQEPNNPKTIPQRIHEIERNVRFNAYGIIASGGMIFLGSSASVIFALIVRDIQCASLLALGAVTSGVALKEFVCHYDSGLGEKEQLQKN